jgi:branched-chain amino acid transport system ATP-binding protein
VVGPNGAGKSTLVEAISGLVPVAAGEVWFHDQDISTWSRSRRARAGVAHVEQGRTVFGSLSVRDNLLTVSRVLDPAWQLFPELKRRRTLRASPLSGGEQQMLVIARALLTNPEVLLIDEASSGLAPVVIERLVPTVRRAATELQVGVLVIEQFLSVAMQMADVVHALGHGRLTMSASAEDLQRDASVLRAAYFA